ncbi:MAG: lysine--tRNA ligase, partial [Alphaproteobacteria bacterium]|nr:lysine--tRNA ligase [Alphaproteobacteria bacterium]
EAERLLKRFAKAPPAKGYVLFETGYGPSGLPHIGTFGEVARTTMVRRALAELSDLPSRLFAFSDDMDGLRKVPDNIPEPEKYRQFVGRPLTAIPDPFGTHESYGHHMNARLRAFLDTFGFDYEFMSATEGYKAGKFDATLRLMLRHYDAVMKVILPTLGPERRATYSPFLPVCPRTGVVLQVPILARDIEAGTVTYADPDSGKPVELPVTGGHCKLQWKADWAMRWVALQVDYEMSGKDLIDSVKLSSAICRILGGTPPEGFTYELFLDESGEKISKSRGNGLTIDQWLRYAAPESLSLYMFHQPRRAKRLYFDVIPRAVDDYQDQIEGFAKQDPKQRYLNPAWHIHGGAPPAKASPLRFGMLLNLVGVSNSEDPAVLWGFISRYKPGLSPESEPMLDALVRYAIAYFKDFVRPRRRQRAPSAVERAAMEDLIEVLLALPATASAEDIQNQVYAVGKRHPFASLRDWFKGLYEVLFGDAEGPRMGSFIALYGVAESIALLRQALARPAEAA